VEDKNVEGNTFHEYSIPAMRAILQKVSERLESEFDGSLNEDGVSCPPSQEGKLLRIPRVELVMKRACKYDAYEIRGEEYRGNI
jgi:hypothetical protein